MGGWYGSGPVTLGCCSRLWPQRSVRSSQAGLVLDGARTGPKLDPLPLMKQGSEPTEQGSVARSQPLWTEPGPQVIGGGEGSIWHGLDALPPLSLSPASLHSACSFPLGFPSQGRCHPVEPAAQGGRSWKGQRPPPDSLCSKSNSSGITSLWSRSSAVAKGTSSWPSGRGTTKLDPAPPC